VISSGETAIHLLYATTDSGRAELLENALDGTVRSERADSLAAAVGAVAAREVHCVVAAGGLHDGDIGPFADAVRAVNEHLPIVFAPAAGSDDLARAAAAAGVTYVPPATERGDVTLLAERVQELAERERTRRTNASERDQLERTSQHLKSLYESVPLPVFELDPAGEVLRWNRGAEEAFGWSSAEAIGQFNPIVPEDEVEAFERRLNRLLDGERLSGSEVVGQTKSGERREFLLSAAPVPGADGEPRSITAVLNDITAQKSMENRLRELQATAQQLGVAPSVETISEIATEAADDVLGLDVTGLWRHDERKHVLRPVAITDGGRELVPEVPTFTPGNSLAWAAFEDGDVRVYGDVQTVPERYNPDSQIRSEIIVPLGDEGVLLTGSAESQQFSEADVDLFRILGATVTAALVRATREQQLRRQNERLEQFADVLAHDLRNPLATAHGYLDLARESGDPEQFERVEAAHDRIGQLIDDLLALARADATIDEREPVDIEASVREAWKLVDTGGLSLDVQDPPTLNGDPGRLRQLFENLFRNTVEHGSSNGERSSSVTENSTAAGERSVSSDGSGDVGTGAGAEVVTVGTLPDSDGFYVEDDGVGIPKSVRDDVFDHGASFSEDGTGFGLSIVADITRAHGWTVSVAERTDGGARFEFSVAGHGENS
jgi:PAS domain S-box-containing protein